jgi:hypothetical protein
MMTIADKLNELLELFPLTLRIKEFNSLSIDELKHTKSKIDLIKVLVEAKLFHDSRLHGIEFEFKLHLVSYSNTNQVEVNYDPDYACITMYYTVGDNSKLTQTKALMHMKKEKGETVEGSEDLFHAVRTDLEVFHEQIRDRIGILSQPVKDIT